MLCEHFHPDNLVHRFVPPAHCLSHNQFRDPESVIVKSETEGSMADGIMPHREVADNFVHPHI